MKYHVTHVHRPRIGFTFKLVLFMLGGMIGLILGLYAIYGYIQSQPLIIERCQQ